MLGPLAGECCQCLNNRHWLTWVEVRKKMTGGKCMQEALVQVTSLNVTVDELRISKIKSDLSL